MKTTIRTAMVACTVLALTAAVMYLLIGTNVVAIPRLGVEQAPLVIFDIAGALFLVGGLLVLTRKRWLWMIGLMANTLVISIFFLAYHDEPEMMLSPAGLVTKTAQILLEAGLIYLVASGRNSPRTRMVTTHSREASVFDFNPEGLAEFDAEFPARVKHVRER